jgi:hypothetical protein
MSKIEVNAIEPQCGTNLTVGASGDTITFPSGTTVVNNGSQTGFGRTGTVDWDTTAKTASFTAVSGNGYFVNTTSGAITVTLPASPSAGDIVAVSDYAQTSGTNNITLARNGSNIEGDSSDLVLRNNGISMTFVYADATKGWKVVNAGSESDKEPVPEYIVATGGTITECGDYKIHTFTGPGTFTVCSVGNPFGSSTVDYLVVAGGGGGGAACAAGGGGAGGYRESSGAASGCYTASPLGACVSALPVSASPYPITVGGGGSGGAESTTSTPGNNGSNSIFSSITSAGGGYGGANPQPGNSGGSGGGGAHFSGALGCGNTPPVSPPQGNNGENATTPSGTTTDDGGGGGGGAGEAGGTDLAAEGGDGATTSINGSSTTYAGGGGGGTRNFPQTQSPSVRVGGAGGGGDGGGGPTYPRPSAAGTGGNGTANTGGGGGGGTRTAPNQPSPNPVGGGGSGGSGIVIIRYRYQ